LRPANNYLQFFPSKRGHSKFKVFQKRDRLFLSKFPQERGAFFPSHSKAAPKLEFPHFFSAFRESEKVRVVSNDGSGHVIWSAGSNGLINILSLSPESQRGLRCNHRKARISPEKANNNAPGQPNSGLLEY